eukprot:2264300-Alexandrium_andersonii.AAC.1
MTRCTAVHASGVGRPPTLSTVSSGTSSPERRVWTSQTAAVRCARAEQKACVHACVCARACPGVCVCVHVRVHMHVHACAFARDN